LSFLFAQRLPDSNEQIAQRAFRPANVLARRKAYAYGKRAACKYNAESMPTLHQYGIKKQYLTVFKMVKI